MKDLSRLSSQIIEKSNEVKPLIRDMNDVNKNFVSIIAQTPLREKLGYPPMEIRNTIESALDDLKTIRDIHESKLNELNNVKVASPSEVLENTKPLAVVEEPLVIVEENGIS